MLKLDIDELDKCDPLILCRIVYSLPFPFEARFSSSSNGLHFRCHLLQCDDYRKQEFDDPRRDLIDRGRRERGIPFENLLWDVKDGRKARNWIKIKNWRDANRLLESIL